jgi:UDPglucose--hexose-1-phosphate uridylyltransferase
MDPDSPTRRLIRHPLSDAYVAHIPEDECADKPSDGCDFCADLTSGRVPPATGAWIKLQDHPAFVPPTGECYSLIYCCDHHRTFADLGTDEAVEVVRLWQQIYRQLATSYACVMSWESFGESIGQTERHPHGQTYGVSFLPDTIARELNTIITAQAEGLPCPFCKELSAETGGPRAVIDGRHFLAFIPEYARYPYQVHLVARAHLPNIAAVGDPEAALELAASLLRILRAYNAVFQAPMPYMLVLHQLADERFHFHVELLPVGRAPGKLKFAASGELGFGLWVNDSMPETKAAELRECLAAVHLG